MKKNLLLCLLITLLFTACKKDKEEDPVSLAGKWTVENTVITEHINGSVNTDTEPGDGMTMDFQDNGHVVIVHADHSIESLTYAIKPDSKVEIDGDVFEIKGLSSRSATLYLREDISSQEYYELFVNLKR